MRETSFLYKRLNDIEAGAIESEHQNRSKRGFRGLQVSARRQSRFPPGDSLGWILEVRGVMRGMVKGLESLATALRERLYAKVRQVARQGSSVFLYCGAPSRRGRFGHISGNCAPRRAVGEDRE